MLLSHNQSYRPIYGSLTFGRQRFVPWGKPIKPEFGPERVRLLDGVGDFTATQAQIDIVRSLAESGNNIRQIARALTMREIDAWLIVLDMLTDARTGEAKW